jgi:hypothetical protein
MQIGQPMPVDERLTGLVRIRILKFLRFDSDGTNNASLPD